MGVHELFETAVFKPYQKTIYKNAYWVMSNQDTQIMKKLQSLFLVDVMMLLIGDGQSTLFIFECCSCYVHRNNTELRTEAAIRVSRITTTNIRREKGTHGDGYG